MLKVKKVNYDENWESGCETCDWGSSYVNEIGITLEDETYTNIKVDKMYDYALSESDYMQLIANSNDINDFILNVIKLIKEKTYDKDISWKISLEALSITLNSEEIDILKSLNKNKVFKSEVE